MILITGGLGFIGLHTARAFLDAGEDVVLTRHRSNRLPEFLQAEAGKRLHVVPLDVRDRPALTAVLREHQVTGIAHLVAPPLNALPPDEDFDTAVVGLLNVLEAGREAGVRRVTLASSVGVYASIAAGPFREEMPLPMESRSPTETFKKTWEILGAHYADRTGFDVASMRIGSIWGPLFWHGGIFPVVRLCYAAVRGEALGEPALYADDESAPCHVSDCARGIVALQLAEKLNHRIYNLSVDWSVTNARIVEAIRRVIPDFAPALAPGASARNRPSPSLDLTRIRQDTGYTPQHTIDSAVASYIDWLRAHPEETMAVAR